MISFSDNFSENNYFNVNEKEEEQNCFVFFEESNRNFFPNLYESNLVEDNHLSEPLNLEERFEPNKLPFQDYQEFNLGKTVNTEQTSNHLLNQKREREKEEYDEDDNNNDNDSDKDWYFIEQKTENKEVENNEEEEKEEIVQKEEKLEEEIIVEKKKKSKKYIKKRESSDKQTGRRKKGVIYEEDPEHDKFKPDNIMRKIKTFIFKYILEILNNSLKISSSRFYPLNTELNENLKKDFNEKLLDRTIYDIFMNTSLNKRYKCSNEPNKKLIEKIYKDYSQTETKDILEMKYSEVLDYIRSKDMEYFLDKIKGKEKKNKNAFIDYYMKNVKELLINYEDWFNKKLGRNVTKKQKTQKL